MSEPDERDDPQAFTRLDRRPRLVGFSPTADRDREVAQAVEELLGALPRWLPTDE